MICAANSDIGMKRKYNQDAFFLRTYSEKTCLAVVCDGMGGTSGGSEASKTAINKFSSEVENFLTPYIGNKEKSFSAGDVKNALQKAVTEANKAVRKFAEDTPSLKGMGTTLTAVLIIGKTVFCVNVGDSRTYFIKSGKIKQMTKDHSYVQYLIDMGQLTKKEALTFPNRNIITRAVGTEETVTADITKESVSDSSYILLCSDGLTNFVSEEKIAEIVTEDSGRNLDQIALGIRVRKLIDLANRNGGADNITAVVIKI